MATLWRHPHRKLVEVIPNYFRLLEGTDRGRVKRATNPPHICRFYHIVPTAYIMFYFVYVLRGYGLHDVIRKQPSDNILEKGSYLAGIPRSGVADCKAVCLFVITRDNFPMSSRRILYSRIT